MNPVEKFPMPSGVDNLRGQDILNKVKNININQDFQIKPSGR